MTDQSKIIKKILVGILIAGALALAAGVFYLKRELSEEITRQSKLEQQLNSIYDSLEVNILLIPLESEVRKGDSISFVVTHFLKWKRDPDYNYEVRFPSRITGYNDYFYEYALIKFATDSIDYNEVVDGIEISGSIRNPKGIIENVSHEITLENRDGYIRLNGSSLKGLP